MVEGTDKSMMFEMLKLPYAGHKSLLACPEKERKKRKNPIPPVYPLLVTIIFLRIKVPSRALERNMVALL